MNFLKFNQKNKSKYPIQIKNKVSSHAEKVVGKKIQNISSLNTSNIR